VLDPARAGRFGGRPLRCRPRPRGSLLERFTRYAIRAADPDACWDWSAALFQSGYGALAAAPPSRTMLAAHRVSYELTFGPIPEGQCVMHTCDNPRCTNPRHLRLGTIRDNNEDKLKKGRQPRGERHPRAKLKQQEVDLIRSLGSSCQASVRELANWFGVSRSLVSLILRGKCWVGV
jgi:HNH endonuclease